MGVVLCGGSSSRMGVDKALVGSPPWSLRVARALGDGGCEPVVLLGGVAALGSLGLEHLADDEPGAGPLAALTAAARRWPGRPALVASCDLPELTGTEVAELLVELAGLGDGRHVVAFRVGGRTQWSVIALSEGALAEVPPLVAQGRRALQALRPWCTELEGGQRRTLLDVDDPASARVRGLDGPWESGPPHDDRDLPR